jgi:hypothetical protein
MKKTLLLLGLFLLIVLVACQPAVQAGELQTGDTMPEATSEPKEVIHAQRPQQAVGAENLADAPRPEVVWDTAPDALIVSATFCCGLTSPVMRLNYLPDAQIWGDGHMIWVEYDQDGSRRVLETVLTHEQLADLLQQVVDAGFFGMQDRYANNLVMDAADKCLTVNLESAQKTVCEYFQGAPQVFHDLYAMFASGAGVAGKDYMPTQGYLTAHPLESIDKENVSRVDLQWDSKARGISLNTIVESGTWVEGETLAQLWQTVNANPGGMIVQEGEQFYQISLQVPGLSMEAPPAK